MHLTGYVIDEEDGFPDDYDDGDVDSGSTVSVSDSASVSFFSLVWLNSFYVQQLEFQIFLSPGFWVQVCKLAVVRSLTVAVFLFVFIL